MEAIRVAMAQISPVLGDVRANRDLHLREIARAREEGARVAVFPELGMTGYLLKDLTFEVARRPDDPDIAAVVDASRELDVVFSFVEESGRGRFYVACAYASQGRIAHMHRKLYLPTYGLFEEGRHLGRGAALDAFDAAGARTGLLVCEDAWHPSVPYLLSVAGADILYIVSSSPGRMFGADPHSGSREFWERMLRTYAQLLTCYAVFVNRAGVEDGLFFFGHSFAAGPGGEIVGGSGTHEPALTVVELDPEALRRERYRTPLLRDEDPHFTARTLARYLKEGGAR